MAYSRPSTSGSGGPHTRRAGNNNFDKRMSKDDFFLSASSRSRERTMAASNAISRDDSYIRDRMASMAQFHIPAAGSALTPANSPPHHALQEAWVPVRRMDTPESMTSGEIPIGMALGSPAQIQPDASRWQAQLPQTSPPQVDNSPAHSPMSGPNGTLQRKKTGRKKLFGLFGGGKKNMSEEGTRGGLSNLAKGSLASTSTLSSTAGAMPKTPTRSNTQTDARNPRHKPLMSRSATLPHNFMEEPMPHNLGMPSAADPFQRQRNENLERAMQMPTIPRLDVLIPDTKMERYSIMFSEVLKGNGKQEPAASLLARRQATLERLKTVNGNNGGYSLEPVQEDDRARPRRATSPMAQSHPQPAPSYVVTSPPYPSPRLSVFPMPPSNRPTLNVGTPSAQAIRVARSNTSPGRLPSPTLGAFDNRPSAPSSRGANNLRVPNSSGLNPPIGSSKSPSSSQEPIYPTDTSFHFGSEQSGLVLDSPISMDSREENIIISQPFRPTIHEPQWQIVSGGASEPASASVSTTSSSATTLASRGGQGRSPSAASSSNNTHVTKPSLELDASDAAANAALANAVEVSIARQISLSRQQRNLLRPLNTRRSPVALEARLGGGDGRSPLGMAVLKTPSPSLFGTGEPIKETKISTPTLVHRRGSPVDPQNRKSSWVVLESD